MRKYHRWLAVIFGAFVLFIAVTGLMIQIADLKAESDEHRGEAVAATVTATSATSATSANFVCPPDMLCSPKVKPDPNSAKAWVKFLQHLHSGETFGPLGTGVSILSAVALMFFSVSGLWMYLQMWRNRSARSLKPGWFWK